MQMTKANAPPGTKSATRKQMIAFDTLAPNVDPGIRDDFGNDDLGDGRRGMNISK